MPWKPTISHAGNHKLIIGHFVGPGKPALNQGFS
jgi:hypothetical protein